MDREAWRAAVHGVAKSWTRLRDWTELSCWGYTAFLGEIPWRKAWQPTPGFLPGESRGQRSLAGCSPWCCKELEATEQLTHSWFTSYVTLRCTGPHSRAHVCPAGTLSASGEALWLAVLHGRAGWEAGFGTHSTSELLVPAALGQRRVPTRPKVRDTACWDVLAPWELRRTKKENLSPSFSLFFNFIYFIFAYTPLQRAGGDSGGGRRASSLQRPLRLRSPGSMTHRLSSGDARLCCLRRVGSSWTGDRTHVPCIGRQIRIHWTPRTVPASICKDAETSLCKEARCFSTQWNITRPLKERIRISSTDVDETGAYYTEQRILIQDINTHIRTLERW